MSFVSREEFHLRTLKVCSHPKGRCCIVVFQTLVLYRSEVRRGERFKIFYKIKGYIFFTCYCYVLKMLTK